MDAGSVDKQTLISCSPRPQKSNRHSKNTNKTPADNKEPAKHPEQDGRQLCERHVNEVAHTRPSLNINGIFGLGTCGRQISMGEKEGSNGQPANLKDGEVTRSAAHHVEKLAAE